MLKRLLGDPRKWAALGICLIVAVAANKSMDMRVMRNFEYRTIDWRFQARGRRGLRSDIVIVAVDEKSVRNEDFGRWPWPRSRHAKLVDILSKAGASVIGFDIFFPDKSKDPQEDQALADATARAGNVVHAIYSPIGPGEEPDDALPSPAAHLLPRFATHVTQISANENARLRNFRRLDPPVEPILMASRAVGFIDVWADPDNVYRRAPLLATDGKNRYLSLAMAMALVHLGLDDSQVVINLGRSARFDGGMAVPIDERGRMFIDYMGGSGAFASYSYLDVLTGAVDPANFRGKLVLVGVTARGDVDVRPNPYDPVYYGVEIQASALANLLDRRALRAPPEGVATATIFILAIIMGWIASRVRPLIGALAAAGILVGYDLLSFRLFSGRGLVLEMVPQNLTVLLCFSAVLVLRLMTEEREKSAMRVRMGQYLPPHIVEGLASRPDAIKLGGERREITALFCDIRDFTSAADRMSSGDTVALLNRFFNAMDEVIWRHEGLLDNHMGDCVMAFFGAPHDQPDHAERAVLAAIEMREWVVAMADEWSELGYKGLQVGIGICTGEATVGNVGSDRRMHYTAVGDNVNIASRLEELTPEFQTTILASESTQKAADKVAVFSPLGDVRIRGVGHDVTIYEVQGRRPTPSRRVERPRADQCCDS